MQKKRNAKNTKINKVSVTEGGEKTSTGLNFKQSLAVFVVLAWMLSSLSPFLVARADERGLIEDQNLNDVQKEKTEKINICHSTGDTWQFMDTPAGEALQGHLGHGDFLYEGPTEEISSEGQDAWCAENAPEPEIAIVTPTGSLTICKIVLDPEGNVADGSSALYPSTFTISSFDPGVNNSSLSLGNGPANPFSTASFDLPLSLNSHLLSTSEGNDAECVTYEQLPLGSYYYQTEGVSAESGWAAPKYNDTYSVPVVDLSNFFEYNGTYYDGDPGNDGSPNTNSDGVLNLTAERPNRTLVVLNQYTEKKVLPCEDGVTLTFPEFKAAVDGSLITVNLDISGDNTTATLTITNETGCTFPVSLSAYKMYDTQLSTQVLFDGEGAVNATSTTTLTVDLPPCMAQIDGWYGQYPEVLEESNPYAFPNVPGVIAYKFLYNSSNGYQDAYGPFCTTEEEGKPARIQLKKVVEPADQSGWNFGIDAGYTFFTQMQGHGYDSGEIEVQPGMHTVFEQVYPGNDGQNYYSSVECKIGPTVVAKAGPAVLPYGVNLVTPEFNVKDGQLAVCTFTNSKAGFIQLKKVVEPADESKWNFGIDAGYTHFAQYQGHGYDSGPIKVMPGGHTVFEQTYPGLDGLQYESSVVCMEGETQVASAGPVSLLYGVNLVSSGFVVEGDKTVVCTFTNTKKSGDSDGGSGGEGQREYVLASSFIGEGQGKVVSDDGQINCDSEEPLSDCAATYPSGTTTLVTLTATPKEGYSFTDTWFGDCSGNNPVCVVAMDGNRSVQAHFSPINGVTTFGGGGGSSGGGGGGGGGTSFIPSLPQGQVAGANTSAPYVPLTMQEVLGAATELPRTGIDISFWIMALFGLLALSPVKLKTY